MAFAQGTKTLTFELTQPDTLCNITVPIPASLLRLKFFKANMNTQVNTYQSLDFEIGPIIGTNQVIDNIPGFTFLKLPLDSGPLNGYFQSTYTIMDTPLQMAGDLPVVFNVRVRNSLTHELIAMADFGYILLQFEVVEN